MMRRWIYLILVVALVIGAFFAGGVLFWTKREPPPFTPALEDRGGELEERQRQIQALESQVSQLRRELEESSREVAKLRVRLDDTARALSSTEQKLRSAIRPAERSSATPPSPPPRRRPAEPGTYEAIRPTSVFSEPSEASRKVSAIKRGTRVTVVGSVGEWLEVRSKHGNPPGFIRRDDAMFVESRN